MIKMVVVVMMVKPMIYIFRLVTRFLCYRPRFTPQVAHLDTVAIRQASLRVLPHVLSVPFHHCSLLMHLLATLIVADTDSRLNEWHYYSPLLFLALTQMGRGHTIPLNMDSSKYAVTRVERGNQRSHSSV